MDRTIRMAIVAVSLIVIGLAACRSPEATRQRGSGSGGDVGNRPADVKMHEGSDPYWKTRVVIPGKAHPVDAAGQARALSQP